MVFMKVFVVIVRRKSKQSAFVEEENFLVKLAGFLSIELNCSYIIDSYLFHIIYPKSDFL